MTPREAQLQAKQEIFSISRQRGCIDAHMARNRQKILHRQVVI